MPTASAIAAAAGGNLAPTAPGLAQAAAGGNLAPTAPGLIQAAAGGNLGATGIAISGVTNPTALNAIYPFYDTLNGKSRYAPESGFPRCWFDTGYWYIQLAASETPDGFYAISDAETPDLAEDWVPIGSATGTPVVDLVPVVALPSPIAP